MYKLFLLKQNLFCFYLKNIILIRKMSKILASKYNVTNYLLSLQNPLARAKGMYNGVEITEDTKYDERFCTYAV